MTITPGTYAPTIPKGRPKSGRVWKSSRNRTSSILKKGVLQHLCKTFEEKEAARLEREKLKESIKYFKELEDSKKEEAKMKRIEREKRKAANEYKNSQYQLIKADKIKTMSKKQLRMIKKTVVNKHGQVELANIYDKKN